MRELRASIFISIFEYYGFMRKFTDQQIEGLQVIMECEFGKPFSIETAALAANNLYEIFDLMRKSSFTPID